MYHSLSLHVRKALGAFMSRHNQLVAEEDGNGGNHYDVGVEHCTSLDELEDATGLGSRELYETLTGREWNRDLEPGPFDIAKAITEAKTA